MAAPYEHTRSPFLRARPLLLGVALLTLLAHVLYFNFVTDDAYISFVYARNLARHGQLVFNLGERVEGYTNFLWTVVLAALLELRLLPEYTSRVLGFLCSVATVLVLARGSRQLRAPNETALAWDALPGLILAAVPGFACWSSGGLETALFTFLITAAQLELLGELQLDPEQSTPRLPTRAAVLFGLAALTRPEGLLFLAISGLYLLVVYVPRNPIANLLALVRFSSVALLLVVPHLLWRHWYYGWWLPNTFYIKASGGAGAATWAQGGFYLSRFLVEQHLWALPLLALLGVLADRRSYKPFAYVLWASTLFLIYVASVGGDFMGLYRFALPIVPLWAWAASDGLRRVFASMRVPVTVVVVLVLLLAHAAAGAYVSHRAMSGHDSERGIDSPGFLHYYTEDRAAIGRWFGRYAQPDDFAAVGGAGAQVYFSGIPSLDCYGLSDSFIAHKVPPVSTRPGHQKYAPDDYILSRHPTIITSYNYRILNAPWVGPDAAMWQARGYHYVSVEVPGLSARWYSFLLRNDRAFGPLPAQTPTKIETGRDP